MPVPALLRDLSADLAVCLRFFSRLPVPGVRDETTPPLRRALRLLPVAGLVIGALGGALPLIVGVAAGLPPLLAILASGAVAVLVTGGLHEDGLADTADGFGGGASKERKLAIMRDSRIGTYGVLAIVFAIALRLAALDAIFARWGLASTVAALLAAAALSRALALLPLATLAPARGDGLGHGVGRPARPALALCFGVAIALGLALPLLAGFGPVHAILACGAAGLAAAGVTRLAFGQIGGHTGDIGGACQQASEVCYLLGLLIVPGAS